MNKRTFGWLLTGLLLAGVAGLAAPGCGHSNQGDCVAICQASCETGDACEDYAQGFNVDREDCLADCDGDCEDIVRAAEDYCEDRDDVVVVNGAQRDECINAINVLGNYCRADDESEINEAYLDYVQACGDANDPVYECK